jgi:hypothetical protein
MHWFGLSIMFYTDGFTFISSDEVIKVAELKVLRKQWVHAKKAIEEKANKF